MNTNLSKILFIWDNLEGNFQSSGISNRLDYIKKITGCEDNKTKVDYILGKLKDEASKYEHEDFQDYVRITNTLNGAKSLLEDNALNAIDDFEKFINTCLFINKKLQDRVVLPDDYFDKLDYRYNDSQKDKTFETTFAEIYNKVKGFGDITKLSNGSVITMTLNDPNAKILYNEAVLGELIEIHETDEFAKNILYVAAKLSDQGKLDTNQVFLNTNYFTVNKNEIHVKIGELETTSKIYSYNKIINQESVGYIVTLKSEYGPIKLIGVDSYSRKRQ